MTVRERINELTRHETDSVARFSVASYGGLTTPAEKVRGARTLLRMEPDGSLADFREWGIWVANLPLLWQLTVQPTLIVDVWPMSHDDFTSRYGIRPDQFVELAQEGFIIPNLYHYDSDRATNFAKHDAFSDVLMPILAYEQTHCRINSIRRAPFLQAIAGSAFDDFVGKGKQLFEEALSALTPAQRRTLTRSEDMSGALQQVASNWAYVITLRGPDDWTREVSEHGVRDIHRDLRRLMARYSDAAAPYTAAFGGTHLVPPNQIDAVRNEGGTVHIALAGDRLPLDQEKWPGLKALMEISLIRHTLGTAIPEQTLETPAVPEDRHFANFLAFLRDAKERRIRMQSFLVEAQKVAVDREIALNHWTSYFRMYEALKREEEQLRKRGLWVSAGVSGSGGMLGAVVFPILLGEGPVLIAAGLGAAIFSSLSSYASEVLRPQAPELQRKLLGKFEDFRTLQTEIAMTNY